MARERIRSRSSMLLALVFGFMCVGGVVSAQQKSGSEEIKPVVIEKVDENAAAAEQAADKAAEKTEEKAEQAVTAVEKKEEKPMVGAGAAAPGSHEGFFPPVVYMQYGSLTVLGVFQTLLDTRYQLTVNRDATGKDDRFDKLTASFQRARFIIKGHVINENLTYFFQGDAKDEKSFALDMFVGYKFWDTGLSVRVGRFVPEFSYMMPRNTADLAAINYPLYIALPATLNGKGGTLYGSFGVWRQLGLDITYKPTEQFVVTVGVFNGILNTPYQLDPLKAYMQMGSIPIGTYGANKDAINVDNTSDNNRAKDVMLRTSYKPIKNLSVDLSMWVGFPANYDSATGKLLRNAKGELVDNDTLVMGGPGVEYNDGTLHAVGEFMVRYLMHAEAGVDNQTALAAWGHVGYRFTKLIEGILRVDWVDVDLDAKDTMLMRITMGPHFWLEEKHFRILVNLFYDIPLEKIDSRPQDLGLQAQFAALW